MYRAIKSATTLFISKVQKSEMSLRGSSLVDSTASWLMVELMNVLASR